jgi:hypothetical protein
MPQDQWEKEEFERGRELGSQPQSAADEAADIIGRFIQSAPYVAGFEQGQADRGKDNA